MFHLQVYEKNIKNKNNQLFCKKEKKERKKGSLVEAKRSEKSKKLKKKEGGKVSVSNKQKRKSRIRCRQKTPLAFRVLGL